MSNALVIRPARPDDAPLVHDLHTVSVGALWAGHDSADVMAYDGGAR